ncbi:MAG: hypothetical protein ACI92S_004207 [Planctomycetaceae bacterium]|jgi:hypothetical protein
MTEAHSSWINETFKISREDGFQVAQTLAPDWSLTGLNGRNTMAGLI